MVRFLLLSCFLVASTRASVRDRGYNSHPYAQRSDPQDDQDETQEDASGRMEDRGYNSDPYEVNVGGVDNVFSREEPCSPDGNGMFGTNEGVAQSLAFYYQVETLPLLEQADQASQEIIKMLETSVSKALLPALFADQCAVFDEPMAQAKSSSSTGPLRRRLQEVLGLSSNPPDSVLEGVGCRGELSNEASDCYVIDGNMTLYSSSPVNETLLNGIRNVIRIAMEDGAFNSLDPRIVKVSYVESLGNPDDVVNVGTTEEGGANNSLPTYAWVIMGVGVATILAALAVRFFRRRGDADDAEAGSFRELGSFPSPTDDPDTVV